jgi:hypothetical protein
MGGACQIRPIAVVSELSSNAVEHAGTPFHLSVSFDGILVRVLVRDSSREPPRLQQVDHVTGRGRGPQVIDRLCVSWHWVSHPDGKTVWAILRSDWPS